MAHIQKRTEKSKRTGKTTTAWQARYTAPDGRERSKRFDRKVDAENWLAVNGADIARGGWIDPVAGRIKFADWSEQWKGTLTGLRQSTRIRDLDYLDRYLLPTFGQIALSSIDHMAVASWLAGLTTTGPTPWWDPIEQPDRKRKPVSPATAVKALQILRKILATAVRAGKIASNPSDSVERPRIEHTEMRFLGPAEVDLLAVSISPRYQALVLVAAYGGLRIGELAGLRRGRVDILQGRIEVAEICVEVSGHLLFGPPKTRAGRRILTLPRTVTTALNDHLAAYTPADPSALVFTSPEGGPLRVPAWRRRHWNPAVEAAGLGPLRPHDLRHTAVALWIATGANPLEVSRRAGHTSTAFTQDRYGHLFPEADGAVADRLETLLTNTRLGTADSQPDEIRTKFASRSRSSLVRLPKSGSEQDLYEWALEDSNLRPQPCEGCALTN
jgi:integrase